MITLNKPGVKETFLNLIKEIYKRPTANTILKGETLDAFPLKGSKARNRQGCPLSLLLYNIALGSLS